MSLLGARARTPLNTPPAPVPDLEKAKEARKGKLMLDHLARRAELTVAASHELFAASAAEELRRL